MNKWKWWLPLLLLVAVVIWRGQVLLSDKTAGVNSSVPTVQIEAVQEEDTQQVLNYSGTVLADQDAVITAEVAGRVQRVEVQNGAVVKQGQTLITLNSSDYETARQAAEASLHKAQAARELAASTLSRIQALYEGQAVSQQNYEDAQIALKVANADEQAAQAGYAQAERAVQKTNIVAPISGAIYNCSVLTGQMASPGLPLMMIADTREVEVRFEIPQQDVNNTPRPGLTATIQLEGQSDTMEGQLNSISPVANPASRSFEARVQVKNDANLLKPGMFVQVKLYTGQVKKMITVPARAVLNVEGEYYVFLAAENGAQKRQVKTGASVGDRVEILSGLSAGEQLIVSGVNQLQDGAPITIQTQEGVV